jgi:hypothetical protein
MAIDEKSRNLYQPTRLTRAFADESTLTTREQKSEWVRKQFPSNLA